MAKKDFIKKSIYSMEPEKPEQTPEQQEHVSLVDECSLQGEHSAEDLQSYTQLAYYAGHQWIAMSKAAQQIVPLPKEDWQVQYTANRIMPCVRTELAKVTRNKLTKAVVPASSEDEDIRAARLAEKVTEWLEYELKLQEVDEEAIMWALVSRIGFVKPVWNASKGLTLATEDGKPAVKQGDVDIEVLSLFEVKWDPAASKWKDCRWVIHEKVRTCEYVKNVYGKDVPPEEGLTATNLYDGKLKTLTLGSSILGGTQQTNTKNCVKVKEYWEMPTDIYPMGRRITTANGVELFYEEDIGFGEEDTTDRVIPIFPLIHIPIPGKIIGSCLTEQLMPVQREYNKSRSQIIENKNLMANPMWAAEDGGVVDNDIQAGMPGAIIWYKKGFNPPIMLQPQSMGADVYKNIENCLEEFQFISSQQEVSHGTTAPGVTAGVAIQLLQEQDDTKLAPTVAKYGRFKQAYMSYLLKIIRFKYNDARTIKIVGRNKRIDTVEFKGSELTSMDIRFEDMSLTQLTNTARKQYIIELVQFGVLNPQQDRDLIIRMLELGITDELYDGLEIDVQQAMNENGAWAKGDTSPTTREFYNHEVHVAQHNKFRKGDEYEALEPDQQKLIDDHVQEHLNYIMQATIPQQPMPEQGMGMDMNKVVSSLTPEEQQALQQNPDIINKVIGG